MLSLNLPEKVRKVSCCMLMSEAIKGLRDKFLKWMGAFDSKCLRVDLGKTKVMVCW